MFKLKNGVIIMDAVGKGRVTIRVSEITSLKSSGTFTFGGLHIETSARSYRFSPSTFHPVRDNPKVIREAIEQAMQGEPVELSLG